MEVDYTLGGVPVILVPSDLLTESPICQQEEAETATITASSALSDSKGLPMALYFVLGLITCGILGIEV